MKIVEAQRTNKWTSKYQLEGSIGTFFCFYCSKLHHYRVTFTTSILHDPIKKRGMLCILQRLVCISVCEPRLNVKLTPWPTWVRNTPQQPTISSSLATTEQVRDSSILNKRARRNSNLKPLSSSNLHSPYSRRELVDIWIHLSVSSKSSIWLFLIQYSRRGRW